MIAGQRYDAVLQRIRDEDVVGKFIRRDPRVAELCRVGDSIALGWFDATGRLLDTPGALDTVEHEANQLIDCGYRHVIWAGMGGSVVPIQALLNAVPAQRSIAIHPLDSTDPAALDAIVGDITGLPNPSDETLRTALRQVVMIAVAMGMTSEEPIGHLEWFTGLLERVGLPVADHIRVLTIPCSLLDRYAREHGMRVHSVCVADDTADARSKEAEVPPGRMSPPATRPFLLPLALSTPHPLRPIVERAWEAHALEHAQRDPDQHRFVRLAAALSAATSDDGVRLVLHLPPGWNALRVYIEQVLEQSLGKSGKGVVVFDPVSGGPACADDSVWVAAETTEEPIDPYFPLYAPELAATDHASRASALMTHIMGWQLVTAIYGYLHDLPIATEPAVEPYKACAKTLRQEYLLAPPWPNDHSTAPIMLDEQHRRTTAGLAEHVSELLVRRRDSSGLRYLDFTINAELDEFEIEHACHGLAIAIDGLPFKLRRAPAAYHVSEQAQMDGVPGIVSLRFIPRHVAPTRYGSYDGRFLTAGAVATQRAMCEAGRDCVLIVAPGDRTDLCGFAEQLLDEIADRIRTNRPVQAERRHA